MRVLLFLLCLLAPAGAVRAAEPVDVMLVLVSDVSRSIDDGKYALQKQGYVAAFTDPRVLAAIRGGAIGAVGVAYVEFSGSHEVRTVLDWQVIRDAASAQAFADALAAAPRSFAGRTSISAGIDRAMLMLAEAPYEATRRVIDVALDGTNNSGRDAGAARDDAVAAGVTVNGLAILTAPNPDAPAFIRNHMDPPGGLGEWVKQNVIGGPRAFVVEASDFASFGEALTRKLVNEIAALPSRGPARL